MFCGYAKKAVDFDQKHFWRDLRAVKKTPGIDIICDDKVIQRHFYRDTTTYNLKLSDDKKTVFKHYKSPSKKDEVLYTHPYDTLELRPFDYRHESTEPNFAASVLASKGTEAPEIMKTLRHRNLSTTQIYLHEIADSTR